MKPQPQVQPDQLFQDDSQVGVRMKKKGVVIKGKILYAVVFMPKEDFFQDAIRIPLLKSRVQKKAGAILTTKRAAD